MSICIKVVNNKRNINTRLFHYAHFICDCLFPEIINELYKYDIIFRRKTIFQTIGNFSSIYEDVMQNKNIEIPLNIFAELHCKNINLDSKYDYIKNINHVNKFLLYIYKRYQIIPNLFYNNYPEVLLIKRGGRIDLIDDTELKILNKHTSTGKERREINNIDSLENYLNIKYICIVCFIGK
jgi:hypothetical protein